MTTQPDHWRGYFDEETLTRADDLRQEVCIPSQGVELHADYYPRSGAPLLIMNHGGGGYCRLFTGLALALWDEGIGVLLPDQMGNGFSGGPRGDVTLGQSIQNAVDAARWAEQHTGGTLVMAGGSLGSAVAYGAAAARAPVAGVVAHNLYDFGPGGDALAVSRMHVLDGSPAVRRTASALTGALAAVAGGLRIPVRLLGDFRTMLDERDRAATAHWLADPVPLRWVSLRYIASLGNTPPAVPLEENTLPALVINPVRDEMVAAEVTRRNAERLSGPVTYAEIAYGHWSLQPAFNREWASLVANWVREVIA